MRAWSVSASSAGCGGVADEFERLDRQASVHRADDRLQMLAMRRRIPAIADDSCRFCVRGFAQQKFVHSRDHRR